MPKNPPWNRDELILALDLYFRFHPSRLSKKHEEIIGLSRVLNMLAMNTYKPEPDKFRNPNGVYMKLCNFLRYDPDFPGVGLQRGGRLEETVWNEFANDKVRLHEVANLIKGKLNI
jgi:5-methylcytosine-specific restriction protein A